MRDFFYCLIFPHPLNNHRAKFLHFKTLFLVIAFLIVSSFFFSSELNPLGDKLKAFADISTQELLNFTNQKREANGLGPLSANSQLDLAASKKAEDMFAKNYWAHNSPDGTTPWVFIKDSGYDYVYAGENLARGFINSDDVVNAWMASPDHRENLLSENFNEVGFAVKAGQLNGEDTFLVVQEFGNRTAAPVARIADVEEPPVAQEKVLGFSLGSLVSGPNLPVSYNFIVLLIAGFIGVLFVDMIVSHRKKIVRFVGHNVDHAMFLIAVIIVITILSAGSVI